MTSERSECELELEEDHSEISSINVQSFVDEQVRQNQVAILLKFKSSFLSTNYTSLRAKSPPKRLSEIAPRIPNHFKY